MALPNMLTGGSGRSSGTGTATGGSDVFGRKPIIPDLEEAMRQALLANLGNFGDLSALGSRTTAANQQQLLNQLMATDPLFQQRAALQGADIMAQLEGRLPDAAKQYLQQVASERNVGMGVQGSPFGYNAEMGLTRDAVLNQIQQGIQNANAFRTNLASTATVPGYDLSKGFLSGEDQAQRNLLEAYAAAAPDPAARGRYEEDLAREFFNRTQAAGIPRQPTAGGTGGTGRGSGIPDNGPYGPTGASLTGISHAGPPVPKSQRPTGWSPGMGVVPIGGISPETYQSNFPIMSSAFGGQFGGPATSQPVSFIDSGVGSLNLGSPQPISSFDFSSPLSFSDQFSSLPYSAAAPAPTFDLSDTPSFSDFGGLTLGSQAPPAASADDWMNYFISSPDDSGFYDL